MCVNRSCFRHCPATTAATAAVVAAAAAASADSSAREKITPRRVAGTIKEDYTRGHQGFTG